MPLCCCCSAVQPFWCSLSLTFVVHFAGWLCWSCIALTSCCFHAHHRDSLNNTTCLPAVIIIACLDSTDMILINCFLCLTFQMWMPAWTIIIQPCACELTVSPNPLFAWPSTPIYPTVYHVFICVCFYNVFNWLWWTWCLLHWISLCDLMCNFMCWSFYKKILYGGAPTQKEEFPIRIKNQELWWSLKMHVLCKVRKISFFKTKHY